MLLGLLTTIFLIPSTTGADNKPSTLEVLAAEDSNVNNLMKRMLNRKAAEPLLRPNDERLIEDQGSLHSHPDVERGAEQGGYTDNVIEQEMKGRIWTAQNQLRGEGSEDVELNEMDEINLGEPALVGSPPGRLGPNRPAPAVRDQTLFNT